MQYYTYAHYRNDDKSMFYIGKGSGKRAYSKSGRNRHWNNIVNKHGYSIEILSYWEDENQAYEHETLLISIFRDLKINLVNVTPGGDSPPNHKGEKQTESHIQKRFEWRKDFKHSEDTKNKISSKLIGRNQTAEHKKNNSIAVKAWWDKRRGIL